MFFLNPTYLWALLSLTIPIAIHLWNKREGKTIKIGSIQLLSEADSKQNSSISLNELLLLFIRMFLIALLVFIIAEPQVKLEIEKTPLTYIVEPLLISNKEIATLIDSIDSESSVRLLQKGFPELDQDNISVPNHNVPNYWQLAKEMDKLYTDSIIVFTTALAKGLKGKRPQINSNIDWIILDTGETLENIIQVTKKEDTIEFLSVVSNSQRVSFKKDRLYINSGAVELNEAKDSIKLARNNSDKWQPIQIEKSIKVLVFYDSNLTNEATYIEAAFKAISKHIDRSIELDVVKDDTSSLEDSIYDCVVWLSQKQVIVGFEKTLIYKPDSLAKSMIVEGASKNMFYLTKTLNTESIIDEHLPEQLIAMLDLHSSLNDSIRINDKRAVAKEELLTKQQEVKTEKTYANVLDISKWIWILFATILVLERIVARYRKQ